MDHFDPIEVKISIRLSCTKFGQKNVELVQELQHIVRDLLVEIALDGLRVEETGHLFTTQKGIEVRSVYLVHCDDSMSRLSQKLRELYDSTSPSDSGQGGPLGTRNGTSSNGAP